MTLARRCWRCSIRGRIRREARNPSIALLIWAYRRSSIRAAVPLAHAHRRARCSSASRSIPFLSLGTEFMPPLNEGDDPLHADAPPGISITEATPILQIQDASSKDSRGRTGLRQGRPRRDRDRSRAALDGRDRRDSSKPPRAVAARHDLGQALAGDERSSATRACRTSGGCRSRPAPRCSRPACAAPLGIKVFGPTSPRSRTSAVQIEKALNDVPGTRSAFAERTTGGYFLDFKVNREAAARYGLTRGGRQRRGRGRDRRQDHRRPSKAASVTRSACATRATSARTSTRSSGVCPSAARDGSPAAAGASVSWRRFRSRCSLISLQDRSAFDPRRKRSACRLRLRRITTTTSRLREPLQSASPRPSKFPPGYTSNGRGNLSISRALKKRL